MKKSQMYRKETKYKAQAETCSLVYSSTNEQSFKSHKSQFGQKRAKGRNEHSLTPLSLLQSKKF
jgi:hypothetical protein